MPITTHQKDELLRLVAAGKKIEAIKRLREMTGVGLQEATAALEMLEQHSGVKTGAARNVIASAASAIDPGQIKRAEEAAMAALRDNNVMEAVKRYRQHSRVGLNEAKEAVDVLSVVHRSNGRVNAKLARAVMEKVFAGQKDEALTLVMSNAGYDDTEARALIRNIGNMRLSASSCAGGCLRMILILAVLAALVGFGMKQLGLF